MNGLSLCSGVGGLDLALHIAFPAYRTVAAVESNPEAAKRFAARFPEALVFEDVLRFDGRPWRGAIDCVLAGWPCQPHSVAGKRRGTSDERWIWDDIARILGECEAPLFFGENVSGLLRDTDRLPDPGEDLDEYSADAIGGMGTVLRDLAQVGFDVQWGSLRAADVGASHGRLRVFIVAQSRHRLLAEGIRLAARDETCGWPHGGSSGPGGILEHPSPTISHEQRAEPHRVPGGPANGSGILADAQYPERRQETSPGIRPVQGSDAGRQAAGWPGECSTMLAHTGQPRLPRPECDGLPGPHGNHEGGTAPELRGAPLFAPGPSDPLWPAILRARPDLTPALSPVEKALAIAVQEGWGDLPEEAEPRLHRLADGCARWLHERRVRLQLDGNMVVPLQAATVFTVLTRRMGLI